jgi:predicted nucleic acid-binding protein
MTVLITDTNIFFDLISVEALPEFFGMDFTICTTDFVLDEIKRIDQADLVQQFVRSKQLPVFSFTADELGEVVTIKTTRNLRRIADKSVLWKALQLCCRLLTGDKALRQEAESAGLEVNGSIWVVGKLVEKGIISRETGCAVLERLKIINTSLPKDEMDKLINKWK